MNQALLNKAARSLSLIVAFTLSTLGLAQLTVSPQTDLEQLARTITGPGVSIANPQINCHPQGYGQFQYEGSILGIEEGILLTSGKIEYAIGPNNQEDKTFEQHRSGNAILNKVTGRRTYDACLFEFDVIPAGDSLEFEFVFGSEEYNEWVGSQYNDVFGFFISGPDIIGDPGIGNDKNIALIPGTDQAVAINNVNAASNPEYYYDNAGGQYLQYDGFTQGLRAVAKVTPCQTYHLKLVVADASDRKYDSGVFIAKVSSNPVSMELITANGGDTLIEGCNNGVVRFTRQVVTDQDLVLEYFLHGTATNGMDYETIGSTDPTEPNTITIPANQAYVDQAINVIDDGIDEGPETLLFILGNPYCPGMDADTLVVHIIDSLHTSISAPQTICQGEQVELEASGGDTYAWSPAEGLSATDVPNPIAQPGSTTIYTAIISAGDCQQIVQTQVKVSQLAASANITKPLCHGAQNGAINLSVSNGIPPYDFQWSGPDGFSATTEDISGIGAGTYTVTIHDASCTVTKSFNVGQPATLQVSLDPAMLIFGQNISCHGGNDGSITTTIIGGTTPYSVAWAGPDGYSSSTVSPAGLTAGTYSILVTDASGCTAAAEATLTESGAMSAEITDLAHVSCANDNNGAATVTVTGGMPTYSYAWNTVPVQHGATATNLAPGAYSVTATDQYGCEVQASATINGPQQSLAVQLQARTHVSCHGASDGSATISVSGGTPGYAIAWNTTPEQTGATASGLPGGTYTATATDANGCSATKEVVINEPAEPLTVAIVSQSDADCFNNATGQASVQAYGGTGPYAYQWNTTPPRSGASITGLPAGDHTVTITDAKGCSTSTVVSIGGPASTLSASITSPTNPGCHAGTDGSINVHAEGGSAPYSYTWNTSPTQSGATATGLGAGTWNVIITDANGCSTTATHTLTQPEPLSLTGTVEAAQCQGAANGAVTLTTEGGTAPYDWSWSGPSGFSANTESIGALAAGGYSVSVTDAHGCSATRSFDVNQPGLFAVTPTVSSFGNANVSCIGSTDGAITLDVNGAVPPYSFSWSGPNGFTSSQQSPGSLAAGSYSVTITDDNGCSTSLDIWLAAPPTLTIALTRSDQGGSAITCHGASDGSISTAVSGGNAPYSYSWTGPDGFTSTDADIIGLAAGSYQLTVTDDHGCTGVETIELTSPAPLVITPGGSTAAGCFGSNTGQASVSVNGGRAPYTYEWNTTPSQHSATAIGLAAGTYTVAVADANGCSTSATVAVGGPEAPLSLSISSWVNVLCHGAATGEATAEATGGTPPYSYVWNSVPPQSGATATGLAAGSYTVEATDAAGCTAIRNVTISQPQGPLAVSGVQQYPVGCFGEDNGGASITVTGGSGNYGIVWDTDPVQTGSTIGGLAAGTYTATITDLNGCDQPLEQSVTISGPSAPISVTMDAFTYPGGAHVSCPGNIDGSINLTVHGGTPYFLYYWQDGNGTVYTTPDISGLGAGTYWLNITDSRGCVLDTSITLTAPEPISATANTISTLCHGSSDGAIDMTPAGGVPPYSYAWTGPGGYTSSGQDLNDIPAGVYTVSITDANGCSIQQPFDVTEPGTFTFDATVSDATCHDNTDGMIAVDASGGTMPYTYEWIGPAGYTATGHTISGLGMGTYHMTLTDDNGCSALFSATIDAPAPLTVFSISHKNHGGYDISCSGGFDGVITTTYEGGTPPYDFSWLGPNAFTANTPDIDYLGAGTYTLTVTDANGCSVTISLTLVEAEEVSAQLQASSYPGGFGVSCNGANDGSIILTPDGGVGPYSVVWSGPNGYSATALQITGLEPGTYTAVMSDANGCEVTTSTTLTAPDPITLDAIGTEVTCHGANDGTIVLDVQGGNPAYTIAWSGPNGFTATSTALSGLAPGTYAVTVTDINGCTASTTVTIDGPTAIELTAQVTTTECQGANTGAIDLSVNGGAGGYTYAWTGFPAYSATTQDISDLFAGVYTVTVTDAAGCSVTRSYNVGEPDLFDISAELSTVAGGYNVSCADANNGTIDATVSGGTPPYSYFWTGPNGFTSIDLNLTGLSAGTYQLTVHDDNGCNASASFTLVAPTPIQLTLTPTASPSCTNSDEGSIMASVIGGVAPYSIAWMGPDGPLGIGTMVSSLPAGVYEATVTDELGCTATATITLTSPSDIEPTATAFVHPNGSNLSCNDAADGSIDLEIIGGTAPYTVSWSGPNGYTSNDANINGLESGLYTALITDHNGCTSAVQVELTAPDPLELQVVTSSYSSGYGVSCTDATDGTIGLTIQGGNPAYTVSWSGPNGFTSADTDLDNLAPGTYTAEVTDNAGCTATTTVNLQAPPPITATATLSAHGGFEVGCDGNDGSITLTVSGGTPPYQFDWNGPNGFASSDQDIDDLGAGTYTVTITDADGCNIDRSYTLTAADELVVSLDVVSNECDVTANGEITANISGGVGPFVIEWTGPDGFSSSDAHITNLASGDYQMTVTSDNGCTTTAQTTILAASPMNLDLYVSVYGDVNIACHGASTGTIELTVSGGFEPVSVTWSGPNGFSANTANINQLAAGTYNALITDANGCTRDTSVTLTEPDEPLITDFDVTHLACFGDSTGSILTTVHGGAGPYTFDWRAPDSTAYYTQDLHDLIAGDYELVITDANACTATLNVTVEGPADPLEADLTLSDYSGYNTSCSDSDDGSIELVMSGGTPGYTYDWSGPGNFSSSNADLSNLVAGSYTLVVTDANGCTLEQDITLEGPPPITVEAHADTLPSGSHISCHGANDGAITATVEGGVGQLTWQWSGPNGFTSNDLELDQLAPGSYCLNVSDENGCSAQSCITIESPEVLQVSVDGTDASCGESNGQVTAVISGGTGPFVYAWNTGGQSAGQTDLEPGTYAVLVTDANGCEAQASASIEGTPSVEVSVEVEAPLCHGSTDGSIALEITSGQAPFTIEWDNGETGESLEGLESGIHAVTVTDDNGCSWQAEIAVEDPEELVVDTVLSHFSNGHNVSNWQGTDGSITLVPQGGTPPYTYEWGDGVHTDVREGLPAGVYTVVVTDANGCSVELAIELTAPDELVMPTGFTPNDDGHNDAFVVQGIDAFPSNQLIVFNRWGNVVFDQLNYRNEWRGENQQGQPLPDGTYFVILKLGNDNTLQNYVDLRR